MLEILEKDYSLFIREDNGKKIGLLTLKDDDVYKSVYELNDDELFFLSTFSNIDDLVSEDTAISVLYNKENKEYVAEIKQKTTIGEYNDQVVWNTVKSSSGSDFMEAVENLDRSLANNNSNSKRTR